MADRAPRILLVDDEQPIQTLLSFPLQRDGYEVVQASDGREALTRFAEQSFDLVVLDVMMPRLDGFAAADKLKSLKETKDIPIVFLSARTQQIDIEKGHSYGEAEYLTKPFDPMDLIEVVERLTG